MNVVDDVDDSETVAVSARRSSPPALVISDGQRTYTVNPDDGPIVVGREFPAQVQINDPRISRTHLRIEAQADRWIATDNSSNGSFVNGVRQQSIVLSDGMTVHLGHPQGIAVTFAFTPPRNALHVPVPADDVDFDGEDTPEGEATDPGIALAGAAVAERRRQLRLAQRTLAREKIMNAGSLIAFEKGRSWPHKSTQAKLEKVLGWEPGTINRIREQGVAPSTVTGPTPLSPPAGGASPAPATAPTPTPEPVPAPLTPAQMAETTGVVTTTVEAPLMAATIEMALNNVKTTIQSLPPLDDAAYGDRAGAALRDLRRLEMMAANAARSARGATEVALVLSGVRRTYRDLMLKSAESPGATLGQRLYAARHHSELTVEEAANAAGVSPADIAAVEAGESGSQATISAVEGLLLRLGGR